MMASAEGRGRKSILWADPHDFTVAAHDNVATIT